MRFVETDNGWVNLDYVARVTSREHKSLPNRHGTAVYSLWRADGELMAEATSPYLRPDDLLGTIVPAAADAFAYVVTEWEGGIEINQVRIVAWKVGDGDSEPVLIERASSNQTVLIPQPDGRLVALYDRVFDNLDEATAYYSKHAAGRHATDKDG